VPKSSTTNAKPIAFSFDAKNREAQRIARDYTAVQITLIGNETKKAVRLIIAWSIREGIAPRDAAKLIKEAVGLNRPQMQTLIDYERRLPAEMPTAVKVKAYKKYEQKLVRRRAMMIARTEVMDALNTGAEVAWSQAQDQGFLGKQAGKEWVTTTVGACEVCNALDGTQVLLGKKFSTVRGEEISGPTAHPNCRCAVAAVPELRDDPEVSSGRT
jgi:hypothetical protein